MSILLLTIWRALPSFCRGAVILLLLPSVPLQRARAQAIIEDAKGRTALLIPSGAIVGINTGDGSAQLAYYELTSRAQAPFYGALIRGKSTDGITSLFKGGTVSPDVSGSLTVGVKPSGQLLIAVQYRRDWNAATVIDSTITPLPSSQKRTLKTWDAGLWTRLANPTAVVPWIVGVAVGRRTATNYADLPKGTLRTLRTSVDPTTGATAVLERTIDGRVGSVVTETVSYVDGDFLLIPFASLPVSFRLFGRGLIEREATSSQRNGVGFDVGVHKAKGDPVNDRLAALVLQIDEARPGDKSTTLSKRSSLALVANLAPLIGRLSSLLP